MLIELRIILTFFCGRLLRALDRCLYFGVLLTWPDHYASTLVFVQAVNGQLLCLVRVEDGVGLGSSAGYRVFVGRNRLEKFLEIIT